MGLFMLPAKLPLDIKPYVEVRERFERRIDRDFNKDVSDNKSDLLTRVRVGTPFKLSDTLKGKLELQYAHQWVFLKDKIYSFERRDVSEAYLQSEQGDWTFTVGRQKFTLGDQRLFGRSDWSITGRSWDGFRAKSKNWDVFAAQLSVQSKPNKNARVAVVSNKNRFGETSLIYKRDTPSSGDQNIGTLSHRTEHQLGPVKLAAEGAYQFGHVGSKRVDAWALHGKASLKAGKATNVFVEANSASGGRDDDTIRTFDNLFPTRHGNYGCIDYVAWSNMNELGLGLDHSFNEKLKVKASYRFFSLRDASDGWYGSDNKAVFIDPTGQSGREIGRELSLEAKYNFTKNHWVFAGFSILNPGTFTKNVAGDDPQFYGFVQLQVRF